MPPNKYHWENDPEYIECMNFLIEKTRDAKSPLNITQLARELKENSGVSHGIKTLSWRITAFRGRIHKLDSVDTVAKVRMAVALGASVDENFLNELRKDAEVKVDGENRITKYKAIDGSLQLEGDHSHSAKIRDVWKKKNMERQEDSDDRSQNYMPKSVKRPAPEVPNSSKKTRTGEVIRNDYSPDYSMRVPTKEPKNSANQLLRQPELEGASGARSPQEAPIFRFGGASRDSGAHASRVTPIKTESGADDAQTPQIKFLEAMKYLSFPLNMPSLSGLRARIGKKIRELSSNENIPNDEMSLAMRLMIAKITNHSMLNLPENVESISLKEFLCYLKAAIMNSELEGLEDLLEKIEKKIREPAPKDKNIAVEKLASVLQETLNNVGV